MSETQKWWDEIPRRLLVEFTEIQKLVEGQPKHIKKLEWLELPTKNLCVRGTIDINEVQKKFDLIYPHFYPAECPTVFPIPRGENWSVHQYGGDGALCLEYGPDNWEPTLYTGANLIHSLLKLLIYEKVIEETSLTSRIIPSRHVSSIGSELRSQYFRFLETDHFIKAMVLPVSISKWKVYYLYQHESCTLCPAEVPLGNPLANLPKIFKKESNCYEGFCLKMNKGFDKVTINNFKQLESFVKEVSEGKIVLGKTEGYRAEDFKVKYIPVLLFDEKGNYRVWTVSLKECKLHGVGIIKINFSNLYARVSDKVVEHLKEKRIAIIGLGSLGSKIALLLARSGLKRFLFVDDDIILPENIARGEMKILNVGAHKLAELEKMVLNIVAEPEIKTYPMNIGSQTNAAVHEKILADLRNCDLVVDCTANPECFLILAMVCSQVKIPLVWGEVFGGRLGGFVAKSDPKRDPCPLCVRRAFYDELNKYPKAPGKISDNYELTIGDLGPVTSTDIDVSFAASLMSNHIIALLEDDDSYFNNAKSIILYGLRKEWIFKSAHQFIHVSPDKKMWNCPYCWKAYNDGVVLSEDEAAYLKGIVALIKKDGKTDNKS